ncbi:hypothetical protein [Rossellomorea marisflavi]|uniref:hypothetical protein n=1 Tax=Rossellomorea marisflavi TaxID=189381 RepID=UPI003458FC63
MAEQEKKLNTGISSLDFVNAGVHIHFSCVDRQNQIQVQGYIPVTREVFYEHSQSDDSLINLVEGKLREKFLQDIEDPAAE